MSEVSRGFLKLEKGAAYVEFCLIAIFLFGAVQGVVVSGNLMDSLTNMSQAAYSAALVGSELQPGPASQSAMLARANLIASLNSNRFQEQQDGWFVGSSVQGSDDRFQFPSDDSSGQGTGSSTPSMVRVNLGSDVKRLINTSENTRSSQTLFGPLLSKGNTNPGNLQTFSNTAKYYGCSGEEVANPVNCLTPGVPSNDPGSGSGSGSGGSSGGGGGGGGNGMRCSRTMCIIERPEE